MKSEQKDNESKDLKDIIIIFSVIIIILVSFSLLNMFEKMRLVSANPQGFRILELIFVLMIFGFAYTVFLLRRTKEYKSKISSLNDEIEELRDNVNRLRSTVDLSPDAILVHREGKLLFVNKAALKLFGAESEEQLQSLSIKDIVHYSYWDKISLMLENMEKYMKTPPMLDITIKRTDGTYLDASLASTPVLYHSIPHVISILRDISDRKKNEEIKSRLASIVLNSSDAIYSMSLDGTINNWNPGAEKLYGYTAKEAIGSKISMIIPEDRKNEPTYLLGKVSKGERIESFETRRMRKDRSIIDISLTVSPLKDESSGIIIGASVISRDITFRKKTEEELRKYAEELAMSNEELYVFSYAASHDLQEPLRSIQIFIETLNKKYKRKFGKDIEEQITSANDGVTRMYRLITDFLTYSRVGTEKAKLEEIDCNKALKQALENMDVTIKESKAIIKSFKLPYVWGNSMQIMQVFQNLISNAIKYKGEDPPLIEISAERENDYWRFSVKDNGIGIEQWFSERIFIIFQKLHDPQKYPGSGIGLALCKRVIEKHGGKIWFESEVGKGTTFYFTLPYYEKPRKQK